MNQTAKPNGSSRPNSGTREQLATRAVFLVAGLAKSTWAPLVPYAKHHVNVDDGSLGLLLLCLGLGSLVAMPLTGTFTTRYGCRSVIAISSILIAILLPLLMLANTFFSLAIALILFGASVGTLDVSMNSQAVVVERDSGRSMMSGFHGLFSLGGIVGAGGVTLLLGQGVHPIMCTIFMSALMFCLAIGAFPGLLPYGNKEVVHTPPFAIPKGMLIVLGILCFIAFMAEGAVLDWSAVFLNSIHQVDQASAGFGYTVFAVAMTLGRLTGDAIVRRLGGTRVVAMGSLLAAAGFALSVVAPSGFTAIAAFAIIGFGASNVVPIFFTAAGNQTRMPSSLAIAAVTTMGYAGVLCGPALIGFVAHYVGLSFSFLMISALLVATSMVGPFATRREVQ